METVAKKYPRKRAFIVILVACLLMVAIGAALFITYIFSDDMADVYSYVALALMILGVILTAMMIFSLVRFCRLPENLIIYENGVLTFPNGKSCRADEVTSINCNRANPSYKNVTYDFGFGLIKVSAGEIKFTAYYAADPEAVCARLHEIVREAKLLR